MNQRVVVGELPCAFGKSAMLNVLAGVLSDKQKVILWCPNVLLRMQAQTVLYDTGILKRLSELDQTSGIFVIDKNQTNHLNESNLKGSILIVDEV